MTPNSPPSPEQLPPSRLLQDTILDTHKQAAITTYGRLGLHLETWDRQAIDAFDEPPARLGQPEYAIGCIYFDPDSSPKPVYAGSILQYPFFSLLHSATPIDYMARVVGEKNDTYAQEFVEAPVKRLVVQVMKSLHDVESRDQALIIIAPDMPPVAVHMDDVEYAVQRDHNEYDDWGLDTISKVTGLFGDESIEYLSDETCLALIGAIRASDAQTAVNPG